MPIIYDETQQGFPYRAPDQPVTPSYTPAGGREPDPANQQAWIRWRAQQYMDADYAMFDAMKAAASEWDRFYSAGYGQGEAGRIEFPSEVAFREAQTAESYWRMQFEPEKLRREEQRWTAEKQYMQALDESKKRTAALEAQLTAMTQLAPHLAAVEPSGYMTGFAPGQIGERLGIPNLRPTRMDINPVIQQMQNVQYPQVNWQSYLGGQ